MSNILITGINGFIGAHLANYLSSQNKDNNIYGIIREIKQESTLKALNLDTKSNVTLILGNVNAFPDVEETVVKYNIDTIYHLAAQAIIKTASKTPTSTYIINILGTLNVLEVVRLMKSTFDKEIKTLVMSTDKAYGSSLNLPYKETHPLNGVDIYSSSKVCEDTLARSYAYNYDLPITIPRACNTYGEYDFNWSRLIPSLAKTTLLKTELHQEEKLILNKGSYNNLREYMYVQDTIEALTSLIDNIDKTKGEAYNISSNEKLTTQQVVDIFFNISNVHKPIEFKEKESTFKEIEDQYLDTTKTKETIGWKSKYTFEKGIHQTINGYKEWFEKN